MLWACVAVSGCNQDKCKDVDCGDFGSCSSPGDEAICFCETGYEQDDAGLCNVKITTKYLGTWQVSEEVNAVRDGAVETFTCAYEIDIQEAGTDIRRLILSNFPDLSCFGTDPIACNLLMEASAFSSQITLRGLSNGITYCDDQGAAVDFSGFQISGINTTSTSASLSGDGRSMSLSYRLAYTLDEDQDGRPESYRFDSEATFTRP